jgi:putative transposase
VTKAQEVFCISERRVCRALGQPRSIQPYSGRKGEIEDFPRKQVVALASQYGRYGYRRITALLRMTGWHVNHKRVERTLAPRQVRVFGDRQA